MGGDEYINKMDQQLPEATILLFRRLAHAKVMNTSAFVVRSVAPDANSLMAGHNVAFAQEACIHQGMELLSCVICELCYDAYTNG